MSGQRVRVAVIGGGIVGAATAWTLAPRLGDSLLLLEAEDRLGVHQTGHNSGVIHSGLYYPPGSLKARLCAEGREALFRFCAERDIPTERCGKVVVATRPEELPALEELERRGRANGLTGLRRLTPGAIREREPHAAGIAGLLVPETGIVDFGRVTRTLAAEVQRRGGQVRPGARVRRVVRDGGRLVLETTAGTVACEALIACGGLQADRLARAGGLAPGCRIIPFRGEYYRLVPERASLVRHLIYPVPDPRFPFLGVHFTRRLDGAVEAGPNAVLAWRREGYRRGSVSIPDAWATVTWPGFWRLTARTWRAGLGEWWRSWHRGAFVRALQRLLPDLRASDVEPGGAGVRAQAVDPTGALVDDFRIVEGERMIHVLNAPSPAATAALSIGRHLAERAARRFA